MGRYADLHSVWAILPRAAADTTSNRVGEALMCGFSDVRQRLDGTYYCTKCYKDLGKDFGKIVAVTCHRDVSRQLKSQCSSDPTSEKQP